MFTTDDFKGCEHQFITLTTTFGKRVFGRIRRVDHYHNRLEIDATGPNISGRWTICCCHIETVGM